LQVVAQVQDPIEIYGSSSFRHDFFFRHFESLLGMVFEPDSFAFEPASNCFEVWMARE